MKIRLSARSYYGGIGVDPSFIKKLQTIAGMTFDVETEHLFEDQYNITVLREQLSGVSAKKLWSHDAGKNGMRIMDSEVEEVIDDVRPFAGKCEFCWKIFLNGAVEPFLIGALCDRCGHIIERMKVRRPKDRGRLQQGTPEIWGRGPAGGSTPRPRSRSGTVSGVLDPASDV